MDAATEGTWPPLFGASWQGHVVRELLAWGAAMDVLDYSGQTPLLIASSWGHLGVVQELLARGAAADAADEERLRAALGRPPRRRLNKKFATRCI